MGLSAARPFRTKKPNWDKKAYLPYRGKELLTNIHRVNRDCLEAVLTLRRGRSAALVLTRIIREPFQITGNLGNKERSKGVVTFRPNLS